VARIVADRTAPGAGWQTYTGPGGPGIVIQVNTTSAGFTRTPTYVTSIGGNSERWVTTGGCAVYPPNGTLGGDLRRGFRIFLRFDNGGPIDPARAATNGWHVNWVGME
jgi:hypothetical protein